MADAVFEGKEGKWITTKTGTHIFIPNDKSVKEVLQDKFEDFDWEDDPDWESDKEPYRMYEYRKYYDFFVPEITDEKEKAHKEKVIKSFKGILDASYAYIKNGFKNVLMKHKVNDYQLENAVADMMQERKAVRYMWLQDIYTRDDTYYNRRSSKISMKYDGDFYSTLSNYYHEAGHALDSGGTDDYLSYTYKDNEYGKSISELLKEEVTEDKFGIIKEHLEYINRIRDETKKKWMAGDISRDEFRSWSRPISNVSSSIGDVIHAAVGYEKAQELTGYGGHSDGYYKNYIDTKYNHKYDSFEGDIRRGTEFFAEMVDDLINNRNKTFASIMEKVAPKTCSVFYKIMKERYGYERE